MDFISYLVIAIGVGVSAWVVIKQKPWWELTPEEKKKRLPFVIAGALIVIAGGFAFIALN